MSIIEKATGAFGKAIAPKKTAAGAKNVIKVAEAMARGEKNLSRTIKADKPVIIAIPDWTLYVPIEMWNLIMYLQQEIRIEFGFDGVVSLVKGEERAFRLEKLVIPKQKVTGGSVDYLESTVNLVTSEELPKLNFHGHSHGDIDAFWSSVDESDIGNWSGNYYLNIVINNKGKVLGRIDFFVEVPGSGKNEHVGAANLRLVLEFSENYRKEYAQTVSKIIADRYTPTASKGVPTSVYTGSVQTLASNPAPQKKGGAVAAGTQKGAALTGVQGTSTPSSLGNYLGGTENIYGFNDDPYGYIDYGYGDADEGYGFGGDGDDYGYGGGATMAADEFDYE